jgi:hypothetical protein
MKIAGTFKPLDIVVILFALALTGYSAFNAYASPQGRALVFIQGQGKEWVYPLSAEETVRVKGPLGITVVRIHDRAAWVESSPCPNKTCIAAGRLKHQGDWTACMPNKVFVIIRGEKNGQGDDVDAAVW